MTTKNTYPNTPTIATSVELAGKQLLINGEPFPHHIGTHIEIETVANDLHAVTITIYADSFTVTNIPDHCELTVTDARHPVTLTS